jgi:hypothetical protein
MRAWHTDFANLDRARVQCIWSGRLTRDGRSVPARFPTVPVECAAVEDSHFFGRLFDGVVAWGLLFLLDVKVQRRLIVKVAGVLRSGGRLLFTAPSQSCSWRDAMTGRTSISLGHEAYRKALEAEAMSLVGTRRDEGENDYYFARKT